MRILVGMYVYLIGHKSEIAIHTYIGIAENFEKRLSEHNIGTQWFPLMVIEASEKLANKIQSDWRREKCSVEDRIKKGFIYTKKHCLTAYVAEMKIGLLREMPSGDIKVLGSEFWDLV